MATATIKAILDGSAIILTSTFESETTTERLQYENESAAEAALQKVLCLDLEQIERQTGAKLSISEVHPNELPE